MYLICIGYINWLFHSRPRHDRLIIETLYNYSLTWPDPFWGTQRDTKKLFSDVQSYNLFINSVLYFAYNLSFNPVLYFLYIKYNSSPLRQSESIMCQNKNATVSFPDPLVFQKRIWPYETKVTIYTWFVNYLLFNLCLCLVRVPVAL